MTQPARQPLRDERFGFTAHLTSHLAASRVHSLSCHGASQIVYLRDQSNADSVTLSPSSFDMVRPIRTLAPATSLLSRHPAHDAKKSRSNS